MGWHRNFCHYAGRPLSGYLCDKFLVEINQAALVYIILDHEPALRFKTYQQYLGGVYTNLLRKVVIETFDAHTVVHLQA